MQIIEKRLDEITPYEKNPRKNDEAVRYVANSIKEFGFKVPIVIDQDGIIVAGHTRLKAAKRLGLTSVPCVVADDLSQEQIKAFRLADNKVSEKAEWDFDLLQDELDDILDFDMGDFGFDDVVEDEAPAQTEEDDFDEDSVADSEPSGHYGCIWQLGRHRLMCGDSTNADDIAKLLDGNIAKLLFTSPPYGDLRDYEGGKDLEVSNLCSFVSAYEPYAKYQAVNLGMIIRNREIVQYWDEYIVEAKKVGYKLMAWNVWDKTMAGSVGQQSAFFPTRHEWIFVFGKEYFDTNLIWEKKESSVYEQPRMRKVRQKDGTMSSSIKGDESHKYKKMESVFSLCSEVGSIRSEHPAVFPVALPAEYIKAMTDNDDVIIEPFCGSGSTLIACEQLDRRCCGMELDPKYCDVIIKRWETLTGKKAVLLNA